MNCQTTIAIALLLLSLTAGAWLLYKTQKESLGTLFKVIAWFVIAMSLGSMICCGIRSIMNSCKEKQECNMTEQCEMRGEGECSFGHGGMGMMRSHRMMMYGGHEGCGMMKECCQEKMECNEGKEECEGEKMDCSKMGGEKKCDMKGMGMKKDSVVVKKK
ncbi:MAG: hypothetical protein HY840_01705 [Bacteroidetes bacterium]|nr:hypothetical protein [Bacteroidota bacterium]